MAELLVQRVSGAELVACLSDLARLRIQVFREYPYLYTGSTEYEEHYLQTYADAPGGVIVLVKEGTHVVGASSGLPLLAETPNVIEPFKLRGYDPGRLFYYGESVLLPAYRGLGLGRRFFEEREAHVRALGAFDLVCFCAVERPADHPRRPADYRPLDGLWSREGFVRHPELRATFSWRDLDEAIESPKSMTFWLKQLN
jgi:GNAT superfamily N-acetyltransferase